MFKHLTFSHITIRLIINNSLGSIKKFCLLNFSSLITQCLRE